MPREHASDTRPGLLNHPGGNSCQYRLVRAAREVRMPFHAEKKRLWQSEIITKE